MKKFLSVALATLMVVATLFGCAQQAQAPASGNSGEKSGYNISVILKTTASEYWGYVQAGCLSYMAEHPEVKVTVTGPAAESLVDEQRSMVETALGDASIDGYAFAPSNSDMITAACAGATKPIVAIDTNFGAPEKLSFIGTGNKAAAKQGGEKAVALAKELGWEDVKCIEIAGAQGDQTTMDRLDGYKEGVNAAGGEFLDDEVQYGLGVAENATTIMEGIMQRFPEGIAIICANNDDMAAAAARAAANNEAYKNTVFLGFDGTMSACKSILAGEETMSVSQEPFQMGYKAVEAVVKALNGEKLPSFIDSGAGVVDPDTAESRYNQLADYLGQPKYSK